ncbi:hypothetical protein B0T25DRAFT_470321, partial [Lasiosphaeria hispida]
MAMPCLFAPAHPFLTSPTPQSQRETDLHHHLSILSRPQTSLLTPPRTLLPKLLLLHNPQFYDPPPYSIMATFAPLEVPLDDLEAQLARSSPGIRVYHNKNSRRVVECDRSCSFTSCSFTSCSCTGCTGALFVPNVFDGCSINWGKKRVLFAILVAVTLVIWFLSKKA